MYLSQSLVFIIFTVIWNNALSQQKGGIEIHADPRIETNIKKMGSVSPGTSSPQFSGYRVQLSFDPDRKTIDADRNRFSAAHPDIETYVTFNAPNFFLKVGDFRSPLEAEKLKDKVISDFPTSFIIKEQVNLPRVDSKQ
jgi:hypothetical protein